VGFAATDRRVQKQFSYTDLGEEAIAAGLNLFFREEELVPSLLNFNINEMGFRVMPVMIGSIAMTRHPKWTTGTIDEVAAAAQEWLNGLSAEERFELHRSTPLDSFKGMADDGFRMMNDVIPGVARIIPAWV